MFPRIQINTHIRCPPCVWHGNRNSDGENILTSRVHSHWYTTAQDILCWRTSVYENACDCVCVRVTVCDCVRVCVRLCLRAGVSVHGFVNIVFSVADSRQFPGLLKSRSLAIGVI